MKTLLILVLVLALAAGAFLSKPSQDNFTAFMKTQIQPAQAQSLTGLGKEILGGILTKANEQQIVYHDHVLWASEDQNGQALYYGAFNHWWKSSSAPAATPS